MSYSEDYTIDVSSGPVSVNDHECIDCEDCVLKINKQRENITKFLGSHPQIKGMTSVVKNDLGKTIRLIMNRPTP
jgi:hypothetical protein